MEVGLGQGHIHIVLDGNPAPPEKGTDSPLPLSAHEPCGQTAGRIKMPHNGREV